MQIAFLMFIMVCCYTAQSIFCKLFSDTYSGEKQFSPVVFSVIYGLFIGICTWAIGGFELFASPYTWIFGLLTAFMLFIYNTSLVNASQLGPYSFTMVCMLFGSTTIPMFVGIVFFNEPITSLQIGAIILMLLSFIVMNYKGLSLKSVPKQYFFWCAALFISNGLFGSFMNAQQILMHAQEREQMIGIAFISCAIIAFIYHLAIRKMKFILDYRMGKKAVVAALFSCLVATIAVNLIMYILSQLTSSIVFTINNGAILTLSILYSFVIFKERPSINQVVGMALSVCAIILFSL